MLSFYIATVCLFLTVFVFVDDGSGVGRVVQAVCCLYLGVFLYDKRRFFLRKKYSDINKMAGFLSFFVLCSTLFRGSKGLIPEKDMSSNLLGLLLAISSCSLFFFFEYVNETHKVKKFCRAIYGILSIFIIIINVDFLLHPPVNGIHGVEGQVWFANMVGGKFWVSYNHLFWTLLYALLHRDKLFQFGYRSGLYIHIFMTLYICIITDCNTALLGSGITFCCYFLMDETFSHKLIDPNRFFVFLLICNTFLLVFSTITLIPSIANYIEETLNRDATLTGRTIIYQLMPIVILKTPLFGFFDTHEVTMRLIHAPNLQNGFCELYATYGIFYIVVWSLLIKGVLKYRKRNGSNFHFYILLYIYFLVFVSSVEISLDGILPFLAFLILDLDFAKKYKSYKMLKCKIC